MHEKKLFARTKIICTLGPSSQSLECIEQLVKAGMDIVRLNFSHGTHEEHLKMINNIKTVSQRIGEEIGIIQDLCGPKIRTGKVQNGAVEIKAGEKLIFTTKEILGDNKCISTNYKGLTKDVEKGDVILIDDGQLSMKVLSKSDTDVECEILIGGTLKSNKGINLPGIKLSTPSLTEKDIDDLKFGLEHGIDFIALSFVRSVEDIEQLRSIIRKQTNEKVPIIAKIEMKEAIESIDAIIEASDAVMVARGDLGVEVMTEEVPILQKKIAKKCNELGVPVIIATQMLESMINNPRPTRAEANDVANAVLDGTDAVMLSAETSVGTYPIEAVQTMDNIVRRAEAQLLENLNHRFEDSYFLNTLTHKKENLLDAIACSTCLLAKRVNAKAIIPITHSGATAIRLSKYRPSAPIIAVTDDVKVVRRLNLVWGTRGMVIKDFIQDKDTAFQKIMEKLKKEEYVNKGDFVVFTAGLPLMAKGTTDTINVEKVD